MRFLFPVQTAQNISFLIPLWVVAFGDIVAAGFIPRGRSSTHLHYPIFCPARWTRA
jgi:hypothetical protein